MEMTNIEHWLEKDQVKTSEAVRAWVWNVALANGNDITKATIKVDGTNLKRCMPPPPEELTKPDAKWPGHPMPDGWWSYEGG